MPGSTDDEWAAAAAAALAPYAWRSLTELMLTRMVVGAVDRHCVHRLIDTVPGISPGVATPPEPADTGDERAVALVRGLDGQRWREWSLDRLCAHLVATSRAWQTERESIDHHLRRLLEGR